MKKVMIGLMTASALVSTPAMAEDGAFYIGLGMGVADADPEFDDGANGIVDFDTDYGWAAEALLGYDLGLVRLEVEGGYQDFDLDNITTTNVCLLYTSPSPRD